MWQYCGCRLLDSHLDFNRIFSYAYMMWVLKESIHFPSPAPTHTHKKTCISASSQVGVKGTAHYFSKDLRFTKYIKNIRESLQMQNYIVTMRFSRKND